MFRFECYTCVEVEYDSVIQVDNDFIDVGEYSNPNRVRLALSLEVQGLNWFQKCI